MNPGRIAARAGVFVFMALAVGALAHAQQDVPDFEGMWSDPSRLRLRTCSACSSAPTSVSTISIRLLDDPDNNERPYGELRAEAIDYQRDHYIRPRLTEAALEDFPWDLRERSGLSGMRTVGIPASDLRRSSVGHPAVPRPNRDALRRVGRTPHHLPGWPTAPRKSAADQIRTLARSIRG